MFEQLQQKRRNSQDTPTSAQAVTNSLWFRLGHVILGGVLALMAIDNIRQLEERIGYADSKGAPLPEITVPTVSGLLLWGSIGISLWRYPALATSAVATFFVSVTPVMHDFWNVDDPQQKQLQMVQFLKNTALLGATIELFGLSRQTR